MILVFAAGTALMMRRSWRLAVPLAVFFGAALLASRNVGVASMVALPAIAYGFSGSEDAAGLGESSDRPASSSRRTPTLAIILGVALCAMGVVSLSKPDYALDRYPVNAVDWMVEEDIRDADFRLAHSDVVGNYLTLRFREDASVFIDDRFEVHDEALISDYLVLRDGTNTWSDVLERHSIDALLWNSDQPLVQLAVSELGWEIRYSDDDWSVVCRPGACA